MTAPQTHSVPDTRHASTAGSNASGHATTDPNIAFGAHATAIRAAGDVTPASSARAATRAAAASQVVPGLTAPATSARESVVAPAIPNARADARRNRALVLAAAQRAFAEDGTSVSLAEIARRAGVGAGTVHRHFPAKIDLLEAVLQQRIDRLTALAIGYRDAPDAGLAFFAFCTEVITSTSGNEALCEVFDDDGWPRDVLREAGQRFHHALQHLLTAAQRQGAVRAELTLADVLALYTGCVAIQRVSTTERGLARPALLVLNAMRPIPVTKPETATPPRNEIPTSNETQAAHCPICATPVRHTGTGRPARYCSAACRQKAHRRRHALAAPVGD